jgi:dihydrodipicolinate synthase/N-acetylneuraminate lyase
VKTAQVAARDGGTATALAAAQATLDDVRSAFERYPLQPATKSALSDVAGLPQTAVRPPQVELSAAQRAELRAILAEKLLQWRMTRTNQTHMSK